LIELEKNLVEALNCKDIELKRENVICVLKSADPSQFCWEKYYNFIEKGYTRNLVIGNELFELMVICWDRECQTPIHDHPSDGCWMTGIAGELSEDKFRMNPDNSLTQIAHTSVKEGEIVYIHDCIGLHSVGNSFKDQQAVTLHLYSPPIKKCHAYTENGTKTVRNLKYYSNFCEKV
jgi:cysteine dioxygenase